MKRWLLGIITILLATTAVFAVELGSTTVILDGKQIRAQESNLGNFVADAVKTAAEADIAVVQATAFSNTALINQGTVDDQAMRGVLTSPTSPIITLKMKPALLRKMMERALSKAPENNSAFLQISGMKVSFDSAKAAGSRVESITVNDTAVDFMDEKTTYTVAMPRELGVGGAGYLSVFPDDVMTAMVTKDVSVMDAIKKEFSRLKGKIAPAVDGRLIDKSAKPG